MRSDGVRAGAFGAWGVLAGAVGSLCCLGPSAAVLLGLGVSSTLFGLQFDRGLALAAGATLLGAAGLALGRSRACDLRPGARLRRAALLLTAFAISYGLLGVLAPALAARQLEQSPAPAAAVSAPAPRLRRATLIVEKMECLPCAAAVRTLLGRKPFVQHFVAETYNQQVIVDYDSQQIDAQALLALFPRRTRPSLLSDEPLQQ